MKRIYLGVFLSALLAGSTTYAERPGRDSSPIIRGGTAPQVFNVAQQGINERRALIQRGVVDNARFTSRGRDRDRDRDADRWHRSRVVFVAVPVYVPVSSDYGYAEQDLQGYYQPGYDWGASLRQYTVGWEQFGPYLEKYVVPATPAAQDAFRRGFIEAFGDNAEALYDRAMRRASQQG